MTARLRIALTVAFASCLAGCVTEGSAGPSVTASARRAKSIAPERINRAVIVGRSTRADVIATLGETLTIRFESGYEIWVYRLSGTHTQDGERDAAEFVILFAPPGIVAKTRLRE